MPFPALSLPVSLAIGIPAGLAGFVAQEALLRRRSRLRARSEATARSFTPVGEPPGPADVTGGARPGRQVERARRLGSATLARRESAAQRGLDAVVTFVDAAPRRAAAEACAEAILVAVPKTMRGAAVQAFLHAAEAQERPGRLQALAEAAGMELAVELRQIKSERAKSA
ncbi:MAG: hypothetical protein ABR573_01260 [Candidatus Dormibacteria bacterium]